MTPARSLFVIPALLLLTACGDSENNAVSNEFGDNWPFTVTSGELSCIVDEGDQVALFVHDDTEYAINAFAQERGYANVQPLLKDHPNIPGAKAPVSMAVMRAALERCG